MCLTTKRHAGGNTMTARGRTLRWSSILLATALILAGCGGDSVDGSDDGAASEEASAASTDSGSDTDEDESGESSSDDAEPEAAAASGEIDCDSIDAAFDSAGAMVGGDPALFGSSPEQQFEEARATMLALREQAPEIADDIDQTIAGLEVIADAFEEIGWDTDFESDPVAAVRLVQLAFSDPAVSAMMTSTANMGMWLAANCGS